MQLTLLQSRLGLRSSTTRLPFRYGKACLTQCPQATLEAVIQVDGHRQAGYSGDCLPPGWFDKSAAKDYRQQIQEMLEAIALAQQTFGEVFTQPSSLFAGWRIAQQQVHQQATLRGWPGLLASLASSLVERAVIDALCRATGSSFARLVRQNLLEIDAGLLYPELAGATPRDWLPAEPVRRLFVRHTVGLADPLTISEIPPDERLDDGAPQALEECIRAWGIRYFKIKLSQQLDHDLARLVALAEMFQIHCGPRYRVTLDGNEQYQRPEDFDRLVESIESDSRLATLWANTLLIEQPLPRQIALQPESTAGIRRLQERKPVIIDESDEQLGAYRQALQVGYRGISSKSCKGPIRSLLNAGLTWQLNRQARRPLYQMTGEDLCSVGIIPLQSDLCLVATLGLTHAERNGHHYHPGLSYLPLQQQQAALAAHADLYQQHGGIIRPHVQDGTMRIGSLQCTGLGFAVLPDFTELKRPDQWQFESPGTEP